MIDDVDRKILKKLQENARITNAQIARELNLAPSGIHERIKKLERQGFIRGYHAELNSEKLDYCVTAFLMIRTDDRVGSLASANKLAEIEEIQEVHHIAGEDCYLVKLRCSGNEDLGRLLREKIGTIKSVRSSRTSVVMETIKETCNLPITK
jgi:Lrp/AsnC family leucine-responsive transcriptional regulator